MSDTKRLKLKFDQRSTSVVTRPREDILAIPKQEYQGQDFFQRQDFRGMLLADHQEAVGDKAIQCVEQINETTVSKFQQLKSFKESISTQKTIQNFLKTQTSRQNKSVNTGKEENV